MIELYNEDCFETMKRIGEPLIDVILTSPFYNTNKKAGKSKTLLNTTVKAGQYNYVRYDTHVDNMSNQEYTNYTVKLFNEFDNILNPNGCILYNLSYGAENTSGMFEAINGIIQMTNFTIADVIVWKKSSAFPNSCSPNRLTRICEFIYVICRKDEMKTFHANKSVVSTRKTGQKMYENVFNLISAKNNDGECPYNKATYSSELCEKLLSIYATKNAYVYDPFMGSGTTAVACKRTGLDCIGSEISANQVRFAQERLCKEFGDLTNDLYVELRGEKDVC